MTNMTKVLKSVAGYLDNPDADSQVKQARLNNIFKNLILECESLDLLPDASFEHAYDDLRIDSIMLSGMKEYG